MFRWRWQFRRSSFDIQRRMRMPSGVWRFEYIHIIIVNEEIRWGRGIRERSPFFHRNDVYLTNVAWLLKESNSKLSIDIESLVCVEKGDFFVTVFIIYSHKKVMIKRKKYYCKLSLLWSIFISILNEFLS